ncbi:hypothetical protein M4C35_22270 [Klebsiella pneumoniae]|nr:hypothetical protein [Klebsiella pneumoniae]
MRTVQSEHDPFLRDFWREESARLYWETDFTEVVESLDGSPRCRWFTGGRTNLSFNALDRHLAEKGEKCALFIATISGKRTGLAIASFGSR